MHSGILTTPATPPPLIFPQCPYAFYLLSYRYFYDMPQNLNIINWSKTVLIQGLCHSLKSVMKTNPCPQ